eukprot:COSAG05_NODE_13074_length_442_cov_1.206997_1_plen_114_part_00
MPLCVDLGGRRSNKKGKYITEGTLAPKDFGITPGNQTLLSANDPAESADKILRVLAGHSGPTRDIVIANASAALWVSGLCDGLESGAERAGRAIDNGQATEMLKELKELTNKD